MREIIINSSNRVSGSSADFTLPIGKWKKMKLTWADIPGTFNNFEGCELVVETTDAKFTISVPAGRYTLHTLVDVISRKFLIEGHYSYAESTEIGGIRFICDTMKFTVTGPDAWNIQDNVSQAIPLHEPFIFICSKQVLGVDNGVSVAGTQKQNIIHAVPCEFSGVKYAPLESSWVHCFGTVENFYLSFQNTQVNLNGGNWACKILVE